MDEKITYEELIQARRQEMVAAGLADKTIRNAISYLRRWVMKPNGRTDVDPVGLELGTDFPLTIERAISANSGNCRAIKSSLEGWHTHLHRMLRAQELPESFPDALMALFHREGLIWEDGKYEGKPKIRALAHATGITESVVYQWAYGATSPSLRRSSHHIREIEKYFHLEPNTLLNKLYDPGIDYEFRPKPSGSPASHKTPFSLPEGSFPPRLTKEVEDLVYFKTAPVPPLGMTRRQAWRVRDHDEYGGEVSDLSSTKQGHCPSAKRMVEMISRFFGFLIKEKGVSVEDLSLSYIANSSWIYDFLIFLADRNGGVYTTNLIGCATYLVSLFNPKGGFLPQRNDIGERYPGELSAKDWAHHCTEECEAVWGFIGELKRSGSVRAGRDPQAPIERILRSDNPLQFLLLLENRLRENEPPPSREAMHARWARDLLLIRLLTTNPLRVNHYKTLTWRPDNKGSLRKDEAGRWLIRFEPRHFKNEKGCAKKKYEALVDPWAAELIQPYLDTVRPVLFGADESDFVFLRSPGRGMNQTDRFMITGLSQHIKFITKSYLGDVCPEGFHAHAFRHIVATSLLKSGHSIDVVASALHDSPDMVREQYGHLVANDGISALGTELNLLIKKDAA